MQQEWLVHNSHCPFYRSPFGAVCCQKEATIRLSVAADRQVEQVLLRLWFEDQEKVLPMQLEAQNSTETLYAASVPIPDHPGVLWYYFIADSGGNRYYYGNAGRLGGFGKVETMPPASYPITVYQANAAVPQWFRQAVVYQIFVDRFYNGNPDGKIYPVKPGSLLHACWEDDPVYVQDRDSGQILAYDFFGGNLAGVAAKLPYLQQLGITAIYLNPIFESVSNHKYDTADYHHVDAMFGSNETLRQLCAKAKEYGIAVILDGVFSHTGSDSIYFNREGRYPGLGAYQSTASPYFSWYRFSRYPDKYESWWGIETMPNVNELDDSYRDFLIYAPDSVLRQWLDAGIAGWRLDVADELPEPFIQEFRQVMKQVNPEAVLIGEVWEDASQKVSYGQPRHYLGGDELDSVTNYPYRAAALDFLLGRQTAAAVSRQLLSLAENYPQPYFYATLNVIGTHDVPRVLTLLGGEDSALPPAVKRKRRLTPQQRELAAARLKLLVLWQMTFPGVPCVYYGDEAGLEGYEDPLNRRTFPWGRENTVLTEWYRKIIALRHAFPVLAGGNWQPLFPAADVCGHVRIVAGGKDVFGEAAADSLAVVLLNRSTEPQTVEIDLPVWRGVLFDVLAGEQVLPTGDGRLRTVLAPLEGKLLLDRLPQAPQDCGILLPLASLPAADGIGGLGNQARRFIDFLAQARQTTWQVLPINPVGAGNSPYQSISSFAGEPLLIDIDALMDNQLLSQGEVRAARETHGMNSLPADRIDYEAVKRYKESLFRLAFPRFQAAGRSQEFQDFVRQNEFWLPDYALYMALAGYFHTQDWTKWPPPAARRDAEALGGYARLLDSEIQYYCFLQFLFDRQWQILRTHAHAQGIRIIGDLPIFVAAHSADVWAHPALFQLDEQGRPTAVAGVPPDYFSTEGQLWGNPLYNWEQMAKDDYFWWRQRLATMLRRFDRIRLDHFRGFQAYWAVPANAETAIQGRWEPGPGAHFFEAVERYLGKLPIIAEDLGVITPEVTALREQTGYPGMKVLQFDLLGDCSSGVSPLRCDRNTVVYTGTHDNATTAGWYQELRHALPYCAKHYLGTVSDNSEAAWRMMELAYQCPADTVIIPLQDVMGLDDAARMNVPGMKDGNWQWRCSGDALTPDLAGKLAFLVQRYRLMPRL